MSVAHIIHLKKDVCAFNFHALERFKFARTTCLQRHSSISIFSTHCAEFQLRAAHTICALRAGIERSEELRARERDYALCVCATPFLHNRACVCALHERLYYIKICACSQRVALAQVLVGSIRAQQINKKAPAEIITGKAVQKQRRMVPTACF
jgi:hypothetical protein